MADEVVKVIKNTNFTVMSNFHLRDNKLSLKAKGLLSLVLSLPSDWDFTIKGLLQFATDGNDSFASTLKDLEKHGYLIRERQRNERGQVKGNKYTFFEEPSLNNSFLQSTEKTTRPPKRENPVQVKKPKRENPVQVKPVQANPVQDKPIQENPVLLNKDIQNTDKLNKDIFYNQSYPIKDNIDTKVVSEKIDMIDYNKTFTKIKDQIEYDYLLSNYDKSQIDEIVELITWCFCTPESSLRINGVSIDIDLVRQKCGQLDETHIEYILHCLENNTTEIKNRRNYMLTCIYNAPTTMDGYYASKVQHDLYGG